jgi:hypothetical protein
LALKPVPSASRTIEYEHAHGAPYQVGGDFARFCVGFMLRAQFQLIKQDQHAHEFGKEGKSPPIPWRQT